MSLNLLKIYQTQGAWYKQTTNGKPVGVLWHDTGAGNPELRRYVQPSKNDSQYSYFMSLLGRNTGNNDWNRASANSAGLNAWVGKLADGSVAAVQAGDWYKRPWGVGSGRKGSLNGDKGNSNAPFWIQFEICDDYAHNQPCRKEYFDAAYRQAVELTAYLCKEFGFDPHGTVNYKGVDVPVILCHQDAYKLGFGSNHADVYTWFKRFGKTMDDVRNDVAALMGSIEVPTPDPSPDPAPIPEVDNTVRVGSLVSIKAGAKWYSGSSIPSWVQKKNWYVYAINGDRIVLNQSEDKTNKIMSPIHLSDIEVVGAKPNSGSSSSSGSTSNGYRVKVLHDALNIRKGAGQNYPIVGQITDRGVYTIVEERNNYGRLKSGAGWIALGWTSRI